MSLAVAGLVAGALGSGISAIGAISSADAQAQTASYQAQVARNNATIANQNAAYSIKAGEAQATAQGLKSRAELGAAVAGLAASGVDVNSGSAADVQTTQREFGQLDTEQTRQNAQLQAYGYRSQSSNFTAEATLEQQKADQAPTAGLLTAGGDLLSGASSLASKWNSWQLQSGSDNSVI